MIEGFGEPKEIVPVTRALRQTLTTQLEEVATTIEQLHREHRDIPSVMSLQLRTEALAKSNRPMALLERVGMMPVGTRSLGEFLLPATRHSLEHLARVIETNDAKVIRANISTIERMSAYTSSDVLQIGRQFPNQRALNLWIEQRKQFLIEQFQHNDEELEATISARFMSLLQETGTEVFDTAPVMSHRARIVRFPNAEAALTVASFPGVRSISPAEEFSAIRIAPQWFTAITPAPAGILGVPDDDAPIVAVVDTGIAPAEIHLRPWVAERETYVLPADTDYLHGTFVAGLVAGARALNDNDDGFPSARSRVLDVAALASTGATTFDEMIEAIASSLAQHPEVKIWNCSFGSNYPGNPDEFGQLARELDALTDRFDVLFVIAAGNFSSTPLRQWPDPQDLHGDDRISLPAESVRGLTVGSVAHLDAFVSAGSPSPFSRRGPGPAKTPKPDITHRGGNCDVNGNVGGTGVRSMTPGGIVGEAIGTSFATPLVATMAANVWQAVERHRVNASPELVKALMIHAAALNSPAYTPDERNYYGFGVPASVMDTLFCAPDTFTLLFEAELYDGMHWEKTPFPIPACLHLDGTHFRGEIVLTLVYSPPVDGNYGAEYVRANVNAHFGTYDPDENGKIKHHGLIPLATPDKRDLYEEAQIDHGFKWSPVKVYRGRFRNGKAGRTFRLYLDLLRRAGEPPRRDPQRAIVLVSMRGLSDDMPVYNDGIRALANYNWVANRVTTPANIRV